MVDVDSSKPRTEVWDLVKHALSEWSTLDVELTERSQCLLGMIPWPKKQKKLEGEGAAATTAAPPPAPSLGKLTYFPVMAKGLQLALIAELSGLPWEGATSEAEGQMSWPVIKVVSRPE